jgi:hypothetical protein
MLKYRFDYLSKAKGERIFTATSLVAAKANRRLALALRSFNKNQSPQSAHAARVRLLKAIYFA